MFCSAYNSNDKIVYIFDAAKWLWSTSALTVARERTAATSVGPLVMFAGGSMDGAGLLNMIAYVV
jgi:hypothetical protein